MGVSFKLEGFNADRTLKKIIDNDKVGLFMATVTAKKADKYVPADTLTLAQTYITRPWEIEYTQLYANKVFYGDYLNFSKDVHPLAQARWDQATQNNQTNSIAKEVTEFVKRQ